MGRSEFQYLRDRILTLEAFIKGLGYDPSALPANGTFIPVGSELAASPAEVQAMIKQAVSVERRLANERAQILLADILLPQMQALGDLNELITFIDGAVTNRNSKELRVTLLGMDEQLAKLLTRLLRTLRKTPGFSSAILDECIEACKLRIDGIQRLINEQDKGEYLYSVVEQTSGRSIQEVYRQLAELDYGGRDPGITTWREWLAYRWRDYELEHPKAKPPAVRTAIISEIQMASQNGEHTTDMLEALHSLQGIEKAGYAPPDTVSRYRRELLKAAGLWDGHKEKRQLNPF